MTKIKSLLPYQIKKNHTNLQAIRAFSDEKYPEYQVVEYAGGEPFIYPDICENVLDIFKDKWVRFISNGTLINKSKLDTLQEHGKAILAISLDGFNAEQNKFRFQRNEKLLSKVIDTLDAIVDREIPLMILCTISKGNIDGFFDYVDWLERRYPVAIGSGRLVMPAHLVFSYTKDNGTPSSEQICRFVKSYYQRVDKYHLLSKIKVHYEILVKLMQSHVRDNPCSIYSWVLSFHMRGDEIINRGRFHGFGCGMRGNIDLGVYDLRNKENMISFEKQLCSKNIHHKLFKTHGSYNKCQEYCFVDWVAVDQMLSNRLSLADAAEWFVLFKDERVNGFIQEYHKLISQNERNVQAR